MYPPLRIHALHEAETRPSWWTSIDLGRTWERRTGDRKVAEIGELLALGDGQNDVAAFELFKQTKRAMFQQ